MKCPFCSATNAEDEHRCKRCGRRLEIAHSESPAAQYQHSAAAPALEFDSELELQSVGAASPRRPVYQPSLFTSSRVVAFESFAPESVEAPAKKPSTPRQKARRTLPGQQSFGFDPGSEQYRPSYQSATQIVDPVIGCDAPVAVAAHRVIAAALDLTIVVIAVALFSAIFRLFGGAIILNKHSLPVVIGIASVIFLLYKLMWCFAGGDTAGMQWARLRLVNLDGKLPEPKQRLYRLAAGFLSSLAAGLGLLWALVDEESLTWHDHISKTFPTPY